MTYPVLQRPSPPPPLSVLLLLAILLFQVAVTAVHGQENNDRDTESETISYNEGISIFSSPNDSETESETIPYHEAILLFSTPPSITLNTTQNIVSETPVTNINPVIENTTIKQTTNFTEVKGGDLHPLSSNLTNTCNGGKCLPYYMCINNTINTDGTGILDLRRVVENPCPSLEKCCPESFKSQNRPPIIDADKRTSCGHRNVDGIGPRITTFNVEAQYGEFPWMMALLSSKTTDPQNDNTYLCGASLIHPKVALTANHCLINKNMSELILRAGEWDSKSRSEVYPHQDRLVSKIVRHSKFHAGSLANDIALIILTKPFTLRENVGTICLPPQDFKFSRETCYASGWGSEIFGKDGVYQNILKKVDLPIVSRNKCLSELRKSYLGQLYELSDSFICAGGELGKDTCKGDGGSPLVCPTLTNSQQYHQAGIVSWGIGCGTETPGLYTDVSQFRNWIDQVVRDEGLDTSYYDASYIVKPFNFTEFKRITTR